MLPIRNSEGRDIFYVVGTNVYGNKCYKKGGDGKGYPSVYTKVKYYLDFIDDVINNYEGNYKKRNII